MSSSSCSIQDALAVTQGSWDRITNPNGTKSLIYDFSASAKFTSDSVNQYVCRCCEFHQTIKGSFRLKSTANQWLYQTVNTAPGKAINTGGWVEDGVYLFGNTWGRYGYRNDPTTIGGVTYTSLGTQDVYSPGSRLTGCIYNMDDKPRWLGADPSTVKGIWIQLSFQLRIYDVCQDPWVEKQKIEFSIEDKWEW